VTFPNPDRRSPQHHLIVGLVVLGLGVILLLDRVGILAADRIFLFWPLILIWLGYHRFVRATSMTSRFWGGFIFLLGVAFQAEELGFSHVRLDTVWPVLLICGGILLIMKRYEQRNEWQQGPPPGPSMDPPPQPGPTFDVPPAPPAPPMDIPPSVAPGPTPASSAYQAPEPTPGLSAAPPPPPPGAAPSSFSFPGPPPTQSNFTGAPGNQRWPNDKNWNDFEKGVHDFGQKMDQFGERMYHNWHRSASNSGSYSQSGASRLNEVNIFWGGKKKIIAKNFVGGEVVAIFGGYEIDLTEAAMAGDQIEIEAVNIFGGGEIRVPLGWEVYMQTVGIFGGCGDRTRHPDPIPAGAKFPDGTPVPQPKRLIVKGVAIFGGLTVRH
jgi:hypothetical protein